MSFEAQIATVLAGDATLLTTLTGGIHKSETVGALGINRETAPSAFDTSGWLKPCALVRGRNKVPTGDVVDYNTKQESARQIVEVWLYADASAGYSALDTAAARVRTLLMGRVLADSYELRLALWIERGRDEGALQGACLERVDWQVDFILE